MEDRQVYQVTRQHETQGNTETTLRGGAQGLGVMELNIHRNLLLADRHHPSKTTAGCVLNRKNIHLADTQ